MVKKCFIGTWVKEKQLLARRRMIDDKNSNIFDFWKKKGLEIKVNKRSKSEGNCENYENSDMKTTTCDVKTTTSNSDVKTTTCDVKTTISNENYVKNTVSTGCVEDNVEVGLRQKCVFDKNRICELHGCEANKVKIKLSKWRYIDKKKEFGFVKVTETKLQCTAKLRKSVLVDPEIATSEKVYSDLAGSDGLDTCVGNVSKRTRDWLNVGTDAGDQSLIGGGE